MQSATRKRTLFLIGIGTIIAIYFVVLKFGSVFRRDADILRVFSQLEKGQLPSARSGSDIIDLLGNPSSKSDFRGDGIWAYGPSLSALRDSKKGDIIGINIYVDKRGGVTRCLGIRKDQ